MTQLTIQAAMDSLELNNYDWLQWARSQAKTISVLHGCVSSDNIRAIADRYGLQPDSPHAWGAIWKSKGWKCIGRKPSTYPSNNCRWINIWKWEKEAL